MLFYITAKPKNVTNLQWPNADNVADNIAIENESINDCNKDNDHDVNENQYAFDDQPMFFSDSHESHDDCIDFHDDFDLGFAVPSQLKIVAKAK